MKIETETPSLMILKESVIWFRIIGLSSIAFGLIMIFQPSWLGQSSPQCYSILFIVFGLLPILFFQDSTITIDKSLNTFTVIKKNLLGSKKETECRIGEIEGIELRQGYSEGMQGYSIFIIAKGSNPILLTKGAYMSGIFVGSLIKFSEPEIASRIAKFLNVPLKEVGPLDFQDAVEAMKEAVGNAMEKNQKK